MAPILAVGVALVWSVGQVADWGLPTRPFERVFASLNNNASPPYRAFRRLDAGLQGSNKEGWLEVWTEDQPGRGFTFEWWARVGTITCATRCCATC